MKTNLYKSFFLALACVLGASANVFAAGYVSDPAAAVQPNSYVAVSTVYNGHRYYLGVDTTAAKSGTWKVAVYDEPCYAAMWIAGGLYSPTGEVLPEPDKNYLRTYKSVYLTEKHSQPTWLSLGTNHGTFSDVVLATDTAGATMWYSAKDEMEKGRFVMGYLYYYSGATGTDVYRYLTYDGLYGFDRAFSTRPAASQRMTRWTRVSGTQLTCRFLPATYTFGLNESNEDQPLPFLFRMRLELDGDAFYSRYDAVEIFAKEPTIVDDQHELHDDYGVKVQLDWASSKDEPTKKIKSLFSGKEIYVDDAGNPATRDKYEYEMMMVDTAHIKPHYEPGTNYYTDTIWALGASPLNFTDADGNWVDHRDYLHAHMTYNGKEYIDSALVIRKIYHTEPFNVLNLQCNPSDHTFPYFDVDSLSQPYIATNHENTFSFSLTANYQAGVHILGADGALVKTRVGDTDNIVYGDEDNLSNHGRLSVSLMLADGEHSAVIGDATATGESWIESMTLDTDNDRVTITASNYIPTAENYRLAVLNYAYTFQHSPTESDTIRTNRLTWVLHEPKNATGVLKFSHQTGRSGEATLAPYGRQQAPENLMTYYVIPQISNPLPIHHDHWGYYRWYIHKQGTRSERDISQNWDWIKRPKNYAGEDFYPIGSLDYKFSLGQFEIADNLNTSRATAAPSVKYNSSKLATSATNFNDTIACEISAYKDWEMTGNLATSSLEKFTEPTLSYRQLFAMRPAKESADAMANCRTASGKYLQNEVVLAPKNRQIQLQPLSPYKLTENLVDTGHLQYVYYYNPNTGDYVDPNMGTTTGGLDVAKGTSYGRVGLTYTTNESGNRLHLLTASDFAAMKVGDSKTILMVAPLKSNGYVLGDYGSFGDRRATKGASGNNANALQTTLTDWYFRGNDDYKLTIKKTSDYDYEITSTHGGKLSTDGSNFGWRSYDSEDIHIEHKTTSNTSFISGLDDALCQLTISSENLYVTTWYMSGLFILRKTYKPSQSEEDSDDYGWIFYEILTSKTTVNHKETAYWEYASNSAGPWRAAGEVGGSELPNGALQISYSGADAVRYYRLVSNHFNLAHFTVYWRDADTEGPSTTALFTEDDLDRNYEVLADLGLKELGIPGSYDVVTPYKRFAFDHTQFSYHYPVGNGEHQLPSAERVFDDRMPAKGEYCVLNKFEKAGHKTVEACAGAYEGYMYCFNRTQKPLVFIDFTYPQPICTEQDLLLMANFCNPTEGKNPHVTADYYGHNPETDKWVRIYRFLTGNLSDAGKWYQLALPLYADTISKYDMFRCVGTVSGTETETGDAFLLFDRFRLMAKNRAVTSFQKHTTCVNNDSIYILSRFDYRSAELEAGDIICFQYQKKKDGVYVPMEVSSGTYPGPYTQLPADETEVYPGYYKPGLTTKQSVETSALKSTILHSDYGMFVVPEDNYDPSKSNESGKHSAARKTVLDQMCTILGQSAGALDAYLDESDDVRPATEVTAGQDFDFGAFATPHMKAYVNEGTGEKPYWVVYIINRFSIHDSEDGTFRISMLKISDVAKTPNFDNTKCSDQRIVTAKAAVEMLVNGELHTPADNHARSEGEAYLQEANQAYNITLRYNPPTGTARTPLFDLFRSAEEDRDYENKTPEEQAIADAWFLTTYGCTRYDFREAVRLFRGTNEDNPNRKATNWNSVSKESFRWAGLAASRTDSLYNLLNRMIEQRIYEVGLTSREIYLGNSHDAYMYLFPVGASGAYTIPAHDGTDSLVYVDICDNPLWLEFHSKAVPEELRFGYDKQFAGTYMVPVIRASKEVANTRLPVRISKITHDKGTNTGITLGWDSTRVVETNDPAWKSTSSFRYTQDKILQSAPYADYYYDEDIIYFSPVDEAHVADLQATDCECLDYDTEGTTYDATNPRAVGTVGPNALVRPEASPLMGCNKWHKQAQTTGPMETRQPGYQVANNFTLHAGYWYKFRTSFFTKPNNALLKYPSNASAGIPLGYAYFIVAVAPDTAVWAPSHDDRTNYWNDDDNWTAIVNGKQFHEALARVPLEKTNVIIGRPEAENKLPIVNNDSLGDVTKGEVDWGFKTATCNDILFRPHSLIYGQELLDYKRAFVDVRFQEGTWRTFSPAIKDVYSGDMYVPVDTAADMASYFAPLTFNSTPISAAHNRIWPYLFFQSFYNQTVNEAFNNTDLDGNPLTYREKSSAEWIQTNVLDQPLTPGEANAIIAWGPTENTKDIIVRLPKQESSYNYIGLDGTVDPKEIKLGRTAAFGEITHNLDFDKTVLAGAAYKDYHLTNQTPAKLFWFGNATMALIDVYQLCLDNKDKLEGDGTTFVVYDLTGESAYAVYVLNEHTVSSHNLYLAPMRAIGIMAESPANELTIRLNKSALLAMPGDRDPLQNLNPAPAKRNRSIEDRYDATLYIAAAAMADGEKYKAYITLAENNSAHDEFVGGEDAECIISHNKGEFTFHTPLSMYTICDNKTLMYDSRELVGRIPLGFAMQSEYAFDNTITLSFATEGKWDRPLYLYDALTNDSIMILNGMRVTIDAPRTDEIRYYINGAANTSSLDDHSGTPTGIEIVNEPNDQVPNDQMGNDQMVHIYDVLGRHVMTLAPNDLIYNVKLPTGVYIISRGNKTERMVIK